MDVKQISLTDANASYDKQVDNLKKNLSKWASNVKKSFELIETSNSYYLNYDRTKLTVFIKNNNANIVKASVLKTEEVKELKNIIKPNRKPDIDLDQFAFIDTEELVNKSTDLQNILSQSVIRNKLQGLSKTQF